MKHVRAMVLKFILVTGALFLTLGLIYGVSFAYILFFSAVITGISYYVGDMFILPKSNNTIATLADFGLCYLKVAFMLYTFVPGLPIWTASLFAAAAIAVGEFFFHKYMEVNVLGEGETAAENPNNFLLQTEFAEEPDIIDINKKRKKE